MDPNAALANIRTRYRELLSGATMSGGQPDGLTKDDALAIAGEVAELFEGLDGWLQSGGFPPDDWALHTSEVQWRLRCKDCPDVMEVGEEMGRRIVRMQADVNTQHRYALESRVHAFGAWEVRDTS